MEDGTLNSLEHDKKRRRKRRTLNADVDDDDDGQHDDLDGRQFDHDIDGGDSKSGKRSGKRKLKDSHKHHHHEPIPTKLYKQMQTLLDVVIKYRDEYVPRSSISMFIIRLLIFLVKTIGF